MASTVLGILGRKRSGKDTFAARLVSAHGYTRVGFADALKAAALALDPYVELRPTGTAYQPADYVRLSEVVAAYGWEPAKEIADVRRTLQRLGSDAVRDHVHPEDWINALRRTVDSIPGPVVIPDVRFPNEVDYAATRGYTVRVIRPGLATDDEHISETALDDTGANFTVINGSDIAALHAAADRVAAGIRHR